MYRSACVHIHPHVLPSPRGRSLPLLFNLGSIRVESMVGGMLYDGHGEVISSMWLRL